MEHITTRYKYLSILSPHHLADHAGVALDDLYHLVGHVFIHIVRHGNTEITVLVHLNGHIHRLQQMVTVDTGQDEIALVQRLGALCAGADAHGREGVADAGEEAALLRQSAAVGHHTERVHLEAVIVVEAQRFVLDNAPVQREAALLQSLAAAGMAGVEDGYIVLFRHTVDGGEQGGEVLLCVDILLPVGGQQNVSALFQA